VDLLLQRLQGRLEDRKIRISVTDEAREFIAKAAYDPVYGARPLRRYIQQGLETPLAKEIIAGAIRGGQTVSVNVQDGALVFVQ
jgi:ATP-dependent Clp protease ATP-binding subunit ClpB